MKTAGPGMFQSVQNRQALTAETSRDQCIGEKPQQLNILKITVGSEPQQGQVSRALPTRKVEVGKGAEEIALLLGDQHDITGFGNVRRSRWSVALDPDPPSASL
ncbi:hypothetical protein [Mesorhizobium shangrilense]|uniref:Uncharacterized protein n=1 Tax=Mesorhizobium shangrilense TaxID=460060 RepID=A0ABV2DRC2_9HYPH